MKNLGKIQISIALIALLFSWSCKKDGKYILSDPPPLDFRSYYDGLVVTFVSASSAASNVVWDFGDSTATVTGDSVVHAFSTIGNYVITMTANVSGIDYIFHTVLRVDKPSHIRLDDNSFVDWDLVNYPDFQLAGKGGMQNGKVDYDANNIYFYLEYVAPPNADLENGIMDIFMDVDNSASTGLTVKGLGCNYLLEGNIVNWFDPYIFAGATQSDWNFGNYSANNYYQLGYTESSGDTVKMEFSVSRDQFKINSDVFQFALTVMNSDWADVATLTTPDYDEKIVVRMDKQ